MEDNQSPAAHLGPRPKISAFIIVDASCTTFVKAAGAEQARQIHYTYDPVPKLPLLSITEIPGWALSQIVVPGVDKSIADVHLQVKGLVPGCGFLFRREHSA